MRRQSIIMAITLMAAAGTVGAVVPETGLYYNPQYQGPGYYLEVQGDTMVMVSFAYDKDTGNPLFYYASGNITKARPGTNEEFDPPPPPYPYEYPYRFDAHFYGFTIGPCLTCAVGNWDTSEHANQAGSVMLRMADINQLRMAWTGNDGAAGITLHRQGFGRRAYFVHDTSPEDQAPYDVKAIPDFTGEWIFIDRNNPQAEPLRVTFSDVEGPEEFLGDVFGIGLRGSIVKFKNASGNVEMTCFNQGCGLVVDSEDVLYIRLDDIGMNRLLAYIGPWFERDDSPVEYRSDHLYNGIRISDPIPDAPPPE